MPAILLAVTGADPQPWAEALRALAPAREIRLWPDGVGEGADVAYACAWYAPRGVSPGLTGGRKRSGRPGVCSRQYWHSILETFIPAFLSMSGTMHSTTLSRHSIDVNYSINWESFAFWSSSQSRCRGPSTCSRGGLAPMRQ